MLSPDAGVSIAVSNLAISEALLVSLFTAPPFFFLAPGASLNLSNSSISTLCDPELGHVTLCSCWP